MATMRIVARLLDAIVERLSTNSLLVFGIAIIAGLIYRRGRFEYRGLSLNFSENGAVIYPDRPEDRVSFGRRGVEH